MKINIISFLRISLIVLLISNTLSQISVFPEHFIDTDSPYSSSNLYLSSDIKERQIYKLGYFTLSNTKIKSNKFGIVYTPDPACEDDSGNPLITDNKEIQSKFFASIKDQESSREKNFSEELELLKYFCSGPKLIINTPFPVLHNTGYILKYKLSMTNDYLNNQNINIKVNLRIIQKYSISNEELVCNFGMKGGIADWFKMTIKSKLSTANKITMMFTCEGENDSKNFDVNPDDSFKFIFAIDDPFYNLFISFYQVILEDTSSSYISSYENNNIIRTFNGLEKCDTTIEESKCLIGYACSDENVCKSCDPSCFECSNNMECENCNILTDVDKSTCEKNYIDLSNFEDIKINAPLPSNEFHERSTLGFWIFISDLSKARNGNSNIYHVVIKDRYVLSIIPNEISTGIYCHAYEDLYRRITSETIYESHYTDRESDYVVYKKIPTEEQLNYINSKDLSGQWFHVSCGLSLDHKKFHVTSVINGEVGYTERALRHENLYYDSNKNEYVENDIYNRHIINENNQNLLVEFRNFGKASSKIYLRYFLLFQEYIPPSFKYMYFDFYRTTNIEKYILLQIKFDKLIEESNNYKIMYKTKELEKSKELKVSSSKDIDFSPPKNLKLLHLLPPNTAYQKINCDQDQIISLASNPNDNIIYWDKEKPLFCPGYLNTIDDKCENSDKCSINNKNYISYPGFDKEGYCDLICSGSMTCTGEYPTNNFCGSSNSDIYNLFYSCESKQTKYYLQYGSFYSPGDIEIKVPPLDSFIIELWYYPDFFLNDANRQGKFYYQETKKNYVFYSNVVEAYFLHSENKKLRVEDIFSTYISEYYHPYEWNKLVFYGKKVGDKLHKYFIINNLLNDYISFKLTPHDQLNKILFSKYIEDPEENGVYYNWAMGYYRDLRIWDGSIASPELTVLYDNYYSSGENRIKSLKLYYPLTNEYIANNQIKEILEVDKDIAGVTVSSGVQKLRKYNFSSKFDFIRSQYPSMQYYLVSDSTAPKAFPCSSGCLRCWNAGSNCYECIQGYMLTPERNCIKVNSYYFKSPCKSPCSKDAELKIDNKIYNDEISPITVTFWIKTLGFSSDNPHYFIFYSEADYLVYDEEKGLCLMKDLIDKKIIAIDENFSDNIGKWTYISLSYYYFNLNPKNYFRKMLNFEINGKNIKINQLPENMKFDKFVIPHNLYAFIFNVRYYHEYLIGAYGFATNNGNLISPFSIPQPIKSFLVPGTTISNCFDYTDFLSNEGNYFECAGERDKIFETFATSFNNYIEIERGQGQPKNCKFKANEENAFCLNACKGNDKTDCTCLNRNYNSQMLIQGNQGIYCKTFDFINFSKAEDIKIKVKTAKETKKFTLQFWIYFINYLPGNFEGATFNWNAHTKIFIYKKDNSYYTSCEMYYIENNEVKSTTTDELELNYNKWNFISCSMNYEERFYYININNEKALSEDNPLDGPRLSRKRISNSEVPEFISNNDWTFLEIKDNTNIEEWGYLFYRQIHLWKDAYFNAEFLSRVNILTPSKFPYLLHSWDTHFKGFKDAQFLNNFIIKDICNSADDIVVSKVDTLGFNYVSELDANKTIELCSEDGEYYDLYSSNENHCLPFADLGLIDDFSFTDIPVSYSGTYSMAFWIFFEDSSTMSSGIHFQWERHLQITVIKLSQLQGYCLPQGYYSDDIPNSQFTEKLNQIPNFISSTLVSESESESGVWIWVLCSVSNYAKKFFLKGNGPKIEKDLIAEDLYFSDTTSVGQPVKNKYPYHFFMSEIENGVSITSKLNIEGLANEKRIYIRDLFLFNDFIPEVYGEAFKHIDLSLIEESKMLQSMVFVCNFANFNLDKMTLSYHVINQQNAEKEPSFTKTRKVVKLYRSSKISSSKTFELCSNFGFIKIVSPREGDLCKPSTSSQDDPNTDATQNFHYCNEDKNPIVCIRNKYLSFPNNIPSCGDSCQEDYIRVPGVPYNPGICSIKIDKNIIKTSLSGNDLINYNKNKNSNENTDAENRIFSCNGDYNQIGYACFDKNEDEKSALFFSRCYNQPNFYGVISNESKEKFQNGYFYEFWFKLDKVQTLRHCTTSAKEEYILYSTPHSIYLDLKENKYYYKIIDSIYSNTLDGISNYEWNKIIIKTTLGVNLGQNIYVYINFDIDNIKASITNIPSSINMQLQYISFCSKEENGECTPAGTADITWGSAYYRNIRIWELYSSSIYSIQDYNIGIYSEDPLGLKLYYPLKISEMSYNYLNQIIGVETGTGNKKFLDNIKVSHEESYNFKSLDEWDFYNYADNFDWGKENPGRFISSMDGIYITSQSCSPNCERCYSNSATNCYECSPGYVLKGMTCVYTQGKTYLKIPSKNGNINFEITNVDGQIGNVMNNPGITITFYMKFEGAYKEMSSGESLYHIMDLKETTTYLAYEPSNSNLDFYIDSTLAFRYNNFYNLIGQWIPYSIAIYKADSPISEIYPPMLTFSVNKEDIPFIIGYSLPDSFDRINRINLGSNIIALFAELRIYNRFIQGAFGHSKSLQNSEELILYYPLTGTSEVGCVSNSMLSSPGVSPICVPDYTDYIAKDCGNDINKYFDINIPGETPCASCSGYCKTKCFNQNNNQCTCDLTQGLYWLRRDKTSRKTYCEYLPSIDYSVLEDVEIKVPTSQTLESTLEFWVFIYSYNSESIEFNSISIEWNLHNKINIVNRENTIYADCFAFYDQGNTDKYKESLSLSISGYSWIYLRCGTDFISQTKKFFLNNQEGELKTKEFPSRTSLQTTLKIINSSPYSFGYVFLRDIKLWQQYNFNYINTQYINLIDSVGLYDANNKKSSGIYPGLITYIKSDFNPEDYLNILEEIPKYKIVNLIGKDNTSYDYPRTYYFKRKTDFLGYNIIDPDNFGYYSDLITCKEGFIYSSENDMCLEISVTKCRYPGDISDNCIACPDESPYIYPPTGECVSDCGVRYYHRNDINQCRPCDPSCYTCSSYENNACLSCTDNLYLYEEGHQCVEDCNEVGLVSSKKIPNLCVGFDAKVDIVNYQEGVPIDINTFDFIVIEVKNISTKNYTITWKFDKEKTRLANPGLNFNFDYDNDLVPFEPNNIKNLKSLNVSLNHSFFELGRNYVFTVDVYSYNILNGDKKASRFFDFTLTTNSHPKNGILEIIPSIGLHNTTIFLIRCQNWTDDTTDKSKLTYYFYAKENSVDNEILLQDWNTNNEITTKFILEKINNTDNKITIYCKVRDNYFAEYQVKKEITVVKDLNSDSYSLENALKDYYIPQHHLIPSELLHLSEILMSLGQDIFKELRPTRYQSKYGPSADKNIIVEIKPECSSLDTECNNRGKCTDQLDIVDEFLVCRCTKEGFIGTNCHISKNGGGKLMELYIELFAKLISALHDELSYEEFKVVHNLFNGAKYFAENSSFFVNQMDTFLTFAMNTYQKSFDNNTYEYIDLLDFYFSYEFEQLNKKKADKIYNSGLKMRNTTINDSNKEEFATAFEYIHNQLINLLRHKCLMHLNTQIEYEYNSDNFYIALKSVNPTFDEDAFFQKRKNNYKTFPKFMSCLNYIETTRLNNPYFQTFMIYIEYLKFPFAYDENIYGINTSPLIDIRFLDAKTGKNFYLSDCTGANQINIYTPFSNYRWINQLNEQKELFDPKKYKSPSDPIFSDPIFINQSGYVSNDTVEQRINIYHRRYNFSCRYYDIDKREFSDDGVIFTNFTRDTNFIVFNTTHLSRFSTFFIENNATFNVKGRFFYMSRTELLKWKGNYKNNFGFIIFLILIIIYASLSIILGCYDNIIFGKETLLESLKKEIVKSFLPYMNKKEREKEALKLIPLGLDPNLIDQKKFRDKTKEKKKNENNDDSKNDDVIIHENNEERNIFYPNVKNSVNSGERLFESKIKNNLSKDYYNKKTGIGDNIMTTGNKTDINLALDTKDYYTSKIGKRETSNLNVNRLPDALEDSEIEYNRNLNAYANLSLSFCEFFIKNILARNILINPFLNINFFCPRYKKLIIFTTNILSELLMLSIFLTKDEKALDDNIGSLIKYSFVTVLIVDTFMHLMVFCFQFSGKQKRRLLKLVLLKGQLIVMKEYEDMQCANSIFTVFGALICYGIWIFSFYLSFAFYAVWKDQNKALIYSFFITIGLDFVLLDCFYELILAVIYMQRKSSAFFRVIGEFLNRVRNHRCLA